MPHAIQLGVPLHPGERHVMIAHAVAIHRHRMKLDRPWNRQRKGPEIVPSSPFSLLSVAWRPRVTWRQPRFCWGHGSRAKEAPGAAPKTSQASYPAHFWHVGETSRARNEVQDGPYAHLQLRLDQNAVEKNGSAL